MSDKVITTAKLLVDKLGGEEPSPVMLGAWLAESFDFPVEELTEGNRLAELGYIMGFRDNAKNQLMAAQLEMSATYAAVLESQKRLKAYQQLASRT